VDFGASDGPLNDEQTTKIAAPVLHILSFRCRGGYVYLGDNNNISLTPDIIADIFPWKNKNLERSPYRCHQQRR
jgi:hypothetical protein